MYYKTEQPDRSRLIVGFLLFVVRVVEDLKQWIDRVHDFFYKRIFLVLRPKDVFLSVVFRVPPHTPFNLNFQFEKFCCYLFEKAIPQYYTFAG